MEFRHSKCSWFGWLIVAAEVTRRMLHSTFRLLTSAATTAECSTLELEFVEFLVNAPAPDQVRMFARFNNPALVQHHNHVRVQNG